ncbi:conserved protein of unknown function (plasmid) [Rhodovastum atsumiense]|uniref:Uncharacterized protein n=1 Tax=Rhodovastum atsumiense TaxID=504468 RepID=A0A5M6IVX8_9PROT|nr:hypothetical protein [Rhodovastum atsumiense]KAA5611565.1 hypothetical protein F1189_13450 [Rhodovastum atsumiense]CAH2606201.1 conserved protein of unknown function [Rhodovastum atsumiense]
MLVAILLELHKDALARTESLCAKELADRTPTDEEANAAAFSVLDNIEEKIIDTRATMISSVAAKVSLALSYAQQNASPAGLDHEWRLVESARADLLSMISSPVHGGILLDESALAAVLG